MMPSSASSAGHHPMMPSWASSARHHQLGIIGPADDARHDASRCLASWLASSFIGVSQWADDAGWISLKKK